MRATIIFLNFFIVLFFGVFLAYTFVAKKHLEKLAIDYAAEKTISFADPLVEKAQTQFERPTVQSLMPSVQKELIAGEFSEYKSDPRSYLSKLAQENKTELPQSKFLTKIISFQKKVAEHLEETLNILLKDLRIFASSNLIAGVIALFLALRSPPQVRALLVWISFLMFVAVCYCTYLYIDDLSFFKILMRWNMGWTYPLLLTLVIGRLLWNFGDKHQVVDVIDETVSPTKIKTKPRP